MRRQNQQFVYNGAPNNMTYGTLREGYDRCTVWLHWLTALLLIGLWIGAHLIDSFPKGSARVNVRSLHISAGVILLGLTIFRIYWRLARGKQFVTEAGFTSTVSKWVHYLLYALVLVTLALGVANAWIRGDEIFGFFHIPKFGTYNDDVRNVLKNEIFRWHETAANSVLIVGITHGVVGLWHGLVLKDRVLQRMLHS